VETLIHQSLLPWHESVWDDVVRASQAGGGVLLFGPSGHGKRFLGRRLAQSLLCEHHLPGQHPCGHCQGCLLFNSGQHPDFIEIVPEALVDDFVRLRREDDESDDKEKKASKEIRIKDIRNLARMTTLTAHRGGKRVVLIWPADEMNLESANAILKTLEEPGQGLCFVLVASHPAKLIPTVRSRVKSVDCGAASSVQASLWLASRGVADSAKALGLGVGAPLKALFLFEQAAKDDSVALREQCLEWLLQAALSGIKERPVGLEALGLPQWLQTVLLLGYEMMRVKQGRPPLHLHWIEPQLKKVRLAGDTALPAYLETCIDFMPVATHPLNLRMQLDDLAVRWTSCFKV
jgi:DNA polymerase-3 subunit delta'